MESPNNLYDVVVVGGGPAGLTAALYLARARYRVVVVEKDTFGGQIALTEEVMNYPGVARTSGKALGQAMRAQAESFGAEFLAAEATALELDGDVKTVRTTRGDLQCFGVLLATGAHPRTLGFPGEAEFRGRGVAYCATCDGEFFTGKDVFVIGGGYQAAEESVFLTKYARSVTVLMRRDDFSCADSVAEAARNHPMIKLMPNTVIEHVRGGASVTEVAVRNVKSNEVQTFTAPEGEDFGVFVFAGYNPETALVDGLAELTEQGYVVTDADRRTSVAGLFAAGDVCVKSLRQVVTATGDGALAATALERYAAELQKKTGLVPRKPQAGGVAREHGASEATGSHGIGDPSAASNAQGGYLDASLRPQLDAVFSRMQDDLVLELYLDDTPLATELRGYMEELAAMTERLSVRIAPDAAGCEHLPCVRVLRADGTWSGLAFHGVPGGHEFTSFVLGLYNAAGPGQPLGDDVRARIAAIDRTLDIQVLVTLGCTMCPDLVVAAQRIASLNPLVTTQVYDTAHYPDLKERYNVMSVPCLVVNGQVAGFGKRSIEQVLDLLGA